MTTALPPTSPSEVLSKEYQFLWGSARTHLGALWVCRRARSTRSCTAPVPSHLRTALLLSRLFGTSPEFWINLQVASRPRSGAQDLGDALDRITPHEAIAS